MNGPRHWDPSHLRGYADNVVVKENYTKLDGSASVYDLEVNESKAKYMVSYLHHHLMTYHQIKCYKW